MVCPAQRGVAGAVLALFAVALRADELPPLPAGADTLVVLPDTERYADRYPHFLDAQLAWIASAAPERRIACAVHLGDITQDNLPEEWTRVRRAYDQLGGRIPFTLLPGNHDYSGGRETSRLSAYFPVEESARHPGFGGVCETGRLDNSFYFCTLAGRSWILLSLEFAPRAAVVEWAGRVLDAQADRPAIVVTHAYLFRDGTRFAAGTGQRACPAGAAHDAFDGEDLWRELIRSRRNIQIVLSGHVATGGLAYRASPGEHGNVVHEMMVDYEKMRGGGMAFLRLLEFLPDRRTVQVRTYSPHLRASRTTPEESFTFVLQEAPAP